MRPAVKDDSSSTSGIPKFDTCDKVPFKIENACSLRCLSDISRVEKGSCLLHIVNLKNEECAIRVLKTYTFPTL